MTHTNKIVKSVLEVLGDMNPKGFSFNGIPILLNKDPTTTYPEIRLSPFVAKSDIDYQNNAGAPTVYTKTLYN